MNRANLSWALSAVLPHVGKRGLEAVGLNASCLYATDRYTVGVARVSGAVPCALTKREATDLMRFVRPERVAEREQSVELVVHDGELHVGLPDDSAVFQLFDESELSWPLIKDAFANVEQASAWHDYSWAFLPEYLTRFAKAQQVDSDPIRLYRVGHPSRGSAAIVSVGDDFIGLIRGMAEHVYAESPSLATFLETERVAA